MELRFLVQLGIIGLTFFMLINASALLVLAERKIMGFMQQRYGPYLVGPHGLLQPLADILKLLMKEELRPKGADKWLFTLAPILSVTAAFAAVILLAGSLSLREVVDSQAGTWFGFIPQWYVFLQPVGFIIYMIAGVAETNRAPFDFPEAEQELVAGYNTEYSSVRFALFPQAEYINMVTMSGVATSLYLGGWLNPLGTDTLGLLWFIAKVGAILFFYIWMRWTLPRYRYDQLMAFGWKFLFPLSVVNLLITAAMVLYLDA